MSAQLGVTPLHRSANVRLAWPISLRNTSFGRSEDLLDDYRFWRERDLELKSLAVSDPEDPDS
jgi:hypothetical protein